MDFRLFIREVCKFPNSHYQAIEEGLDRNAFESAGRWGPIMDRIKDVPLGNEAALYAPLIDLYDSISTQIGPLFDLQSKTNLAFRDTCKNTYLIHLLFLEGRTGLLGGEAQQQAWGSGPTWRAAEEKVKAVAKQPIQAMNSEVADQRQSSFDIRSDPVKLTVAFAALWTTDLKALGFDSHFIDNSGNVTICPQECLVMIGDQEYTIDKALFWARSLLGRGTCTLRAVGKLQVKVVIKFNCPPKVPMVNHFELWEFCVLVLSPVCSPLTSIADLETFKRSFRKLVIAHHKLYETGILHCDISVGNMMYDPLGDEPYLIDVDLGKSVEKLASPLSNHWTGTLPFMATDLLAECPPPHLYRHDLESFYYVLIWICVKDHCGWDTVHSIAAMREKKDSFLAVGTGDRIGGLSLIDWLEPLQQTWINRIHGLFVRGRAAVDPYLGNVESDKETLDGYITFVKVMDVLTA
ncbi:hypothetical protein RHS01_08286 [Rhizoctonia solani]|uniref:Fungal-type protein kinase domain-containing protein n=1 Tax=Rhizoctonia solani TaxID=456999 RepID=A0A8H7I8C4_9AGAM|nr:hypothetical protein RHS01_08286 [Rhizoctonia solani]